MPKWLRWLPIELSNDIATIHSRDQQISEEDLSRARDIIQEKVPEYEWTASRMRSTSQERCEYNEVSWNVDWKEYCPFHYIAKKFNQKMEKFEFIMDFLKM